MENIYIRYISYISYIANMAEVTRTYYPSGELRFEVFEINGKKNVQGLITFNIKSN
jgi:hypothetical protein